MLHWNDLTDDELAECSPLARDTISRLQARTTATAHAALLRGLPREQAQEEATESVMDWAKRHVGEEAMRQVLVQLMTFEVLREHLAAGSLVRAVTADGTVVYCHPDQLED